MTSTSSRARTLSLRAPISNETERAFFQRRLSFTLVLVGALGGGFWLIQLFTLLAVARAHVLHLFSDPTPQLHLGIVSFAFVAAWFVRRGKHSAGFLDAADFGATLLICIGWAGMIFIDKRTNSSGTRAEMVVLLASSYTLATRAALVPSSPLRSLSLAVASFAPVVPLTYAIYVRDPDVDKWPIGPSVYAATWAAVGVACTTTVSHVIYGLRREVQKAMQLGQYFLEEKIGEGGMGVVYRASHALLRRPAAIKLLNHDAEHGFARFEREVQITAKLTHPNTVAVFDYGRTPDGAFYYAMEYLEGVSLEELVVEHGPQPPRRVVHVLLQTCGALEEAHANGLVHRDIKPANIMLTERGLVPDVVKVLDFGLVKETEGSTDPGHSNVNTIMGTPHYMAPEAILEPATIDGRADLYALGATAYYLLTGTRVFEGTNLVEVCSQHLHQAPVPPSKRHPEVPEALEKVVLACLAKKRDDRPKDASALAALLSGAQAETGAWTRDEARAWWGERAKKASGSLPKAKPSNASVLGHTIAVALEDRNRGAA